MTDAHIVGSELIYDGWYKLHRLKVRMPSGVEVERHLEDHGDAAAVLPYDPVRRQALLVSLPRAPLVAASAPPMWEAIAGNLDHQSPEHCARAEAIEEAGVQLTDLEPIGCVWTMPALSTERLHLFLASYSRSDRISAGGGAPGEDENIVAAEFALADLQEHLLAGTLSDAKLIMLLQALIIRQPDLFA